MRNRRVNESSMWRSLVGAFILLIGTVWSPNSSPAQELEIYCPDDLTISCDDSADPEFTGMATAGDPTAEIIYWDFTIGQYPQACASAYTISRTWRATDSLGNEEICIQAIFVEDHTPPSLVCPGGVTVEWGESGDPEKTGQAVAQDNCGLLSLSFDDFETPGVHPVARRISRTWIAVDSCGNTSECVQTILELAAGVGDTADSRSGKRGVVLYQNRPNPFGITAGETTAIDYYIPRQARTVVSVYDVVGRRLKILVDKTLGEGYHHTEWDGRDADGDYVPSGIYIYRLESGGKSAIRKIALLR